MRDFIINRFTWMDNKLGFNGILLPGDVNDDGIINISDVTIIIDYLTGNTSEITAAADFNEDGTIDITDVTEVIDYILANWSLR